MVMGNLDGEIERVAFNTNEIQNIVTRYGSNLVYSAEEPGLFLEADGNIFPVKGKINKEEIKPFFIILKSGVAFNSNDYQILFNVNKHQNGLVSGSDVSGKQHLCKIYGNGSGTHESEDQPLSLTDFNDKLEAGELSQADIEELKFMIQKLKQGEFFELLTMEFSSKIKGIAKELIDFRKDIQSKIEPDIVEMASKDIPEASNQLEGINETLEESTMKIMDINEAQMDMANSQARALETILSKESKGENFTVGLSLEEAIKTIEEQVDVLKEIENRSLNMMEPLSFQDLVGQRIQRIIKLVRSMELRIEELVVSFGIKLKKHKEDPTKTYAELNRDVDAYRSELLGPQRTGEGLDQAGIDDLLANL
jgi:chemotaxis regulatin CheY-phosphate phosphatase CheZ